MPSSLANAALAAMTASALIAGAVKAEDRYGPRPPAEPVDSADKSPVGLLRWPGKAAPAAVSPTPTARSASLTASLPTSLYAPASTTYRPTRTAIPAAPAVVAAPAQPMLAGGQGAPPRFYSVQRQYGVQPDPVALSPQFLADAGAADLAEPPPLPPPHLNPAQTANMSAAAAASQTRAAQAAIQASDTN